MKIKRRKLEVGAPAVAMADIAFNLVLFFIIMARAQDESHLNWTPAEAPEAKTQATSGVSVTVDKDSKVYLNGVQLSITQLAGAIKERLGDLPAGKRTVLMKVHRDTLAATFEPIIEAVSEAGGDVVHVLKEEEKKQ